MIASDHGELSVRVDKFELLSKSLRALPDVRHGVTDAETRYRQRYLDLILDEPSRRVFAIRSHGDRGDPHDVLHREGLHRGRDAGPARARPAAPRRSRSSPTTTRSTST